MIILVDYDNLSELFIKNGLQYIIDSIVGQIEPCHIVNHKRIVVRLYGGWYEKNKSTNRAQRIETEIKSLYPSTSVLADNKTSIIVNCEMAFSLLTDPTFHLVYTFREKGIPGGLKARHPIKHGCHEEDCPLVSFWNFIEKGVCPKCGNVRPEDVLYRGEQKLVDSMITADLIHASTLGVSVGIVSSDDDFWPGIRASLINGCYLIHIKTQHTATSNLYARSIGPNYIAKQL